MKKLILLALVLFSAATMLAQTNRMSYQAVVRNAANELVAEENLTVSIRISDANGTSAFSETHSVTSNRNGVISLMIGEGSGQSGNMTSVDWRTAQIHTEVTLPGGATLSNTTPVNAVPYAFYADSVDIHWVNNAVDDYLEHHSISSIVETDPTVPAWAKEATKPVYDYSEIANTPTIPSVPTNVSAFNNDAGYITAAEVPAVSVPTNVSAFNNDAEYVTTNQLNAANYITAADVPAQVNADWNATTGAAQILNKPELFSGDYNDLTNKPTIPTVPTNVGAFTNDAGYITAAEVPAVSVPTNVSAFNNDAEYVTTNQLNAANYITAADVPAQVNADWNATEGAAQILNKPELFSGDYNDLTNKPTIPTVPTNVGEFNNDAGYITAADIAGLLNTVNELNRKVDSLEDVVANMSEPPVLETVSVSDVGIFKATFHGNITSEGYYSVTARGFCYGTSENPTIDGNFTSNGTGEGAFSHTVTALQANTTYYVRAYVTNSMGTTYGNQLSFTTKNIPTVITAEISDITNTTATCGGEIVADEGITISARGVCWGTSPNPTISNAHTNDGNGTGVFTSSLTGLTPHTTYYIRAYITTNEGTFYGNGLSLLTTNNDGQPCPGTPTVTDHEGNVYNTVQIGTQCWMKENLRTTTSPSTGTYLIPAAGTVISYTGKQARWYNNDSATYAPMNYGLLYNWNAAMDTFNTAYGETSVNTNYNNIIHLDVETIGYRRGICPEGWHLPREEWGMLRQYLSSIPEYLCNDYGYAKALASQTGWLNCNCDNECAVGYNPNTNNATGLGIVPAGVYSSGGTFVRAGYRAYFWNSYSEAFALNTSYASEQFLCLDYGGLDCESGDTYCFSVRCVKD